MAIDVHGGTLAKVHLFNKIADQALIRDLVLKLRSVLYLPGDFICRKVSWNENEVNAASAGS